MNTRIPIIAGNWKMNNNQKQTKELLLSLIPMVKDATADVVVCVPFTSLPMAKKLIKGTSIKLGAQNVHWEASGAFTGEISAAMLKEAKVEYVIIGHSERRQYFGETDETVNKRLKAAIAGRLKAIVCVGELLEERESGQTNKVVLDQIKAAFDKVTKKQLKNVVIAYEPVWAIGTGKTATAEDADETMSIIRSAIKKKYGEEAAEAIRIQYGGSMNAKNAAELMAKPNVDGGLIGGASLKAEDFSKVVAAAK